MRVGENIASGLEMRELTLYYWFFQLAEIFLLGLVVAILCVNLKVPGRTSEESHENPNICSCLQMPPLGEVLQSGRSQLGKSLNLALLGRQRLDWRPSCHRGAAMSGGGSRAALALSFPLTSSRKLQRKAWEERKGNFNGGTV